MAVLPGALAARLAARGVRPGALVWQPPPPAGGDAARARRLARGVLLLDGRLVESTAPHPWDLHAPDRAWSDALHGHGWLDDAAAAEDEDHDDATLWPRFESWVWTWIERYADGAGPGWRADLAARRLSRWIAHSIRLLRGQPPERSRAFFRALAGHARYLGWRWRETQGAGRIEALGGLVYAALSLEGAGRAAAGAVRHLGREAAAIVGPDGIASRNPEELARIAAILEWSAAAIAGAGLRAADGHLAALRRAAPVLRALTTPAGTLARFHGSRGGAGLPLPRPAIAPQATAGPDPRVMGYHRMAAGDAVLILDAAPPPAGRHAATAHVSALGFEFWLGAQPVIVASGSGAGFGRREALAARRAGAHSTVELAGSCPARLAPPRAGPPRLVTTGSVALRTMREPSGQTALAESTLYAALLGLTIERRLHLSADGQLEGEDTVLATSAETRARMAALIPAGAPRCPVAARFRLHPDIRAVAALSGRAVALTLPGGGRWLLDLGGAEVELVPGRYFDDSRARPRATTEVVATTPLLGYWARIAWRLERLGEPARPRRAAVAAVAAG